MCFIFSIVVYDAYFTKVQLESNRNDFAHISLLYNKSNGYSYLFIREGRIGKEGTNNRVTSNQISIINRRRVCF